MKLTLLGLALAAATLGAGCAKTDYSDAASGQARAGGSAAAQAAASQGGLRVTVPQNPHKQRKTAADAVADLKARGIIK